MMAMTTHNAAPTGAITLPIQFTRLRKAPSGWVAVCPWTALLVCGVAPRFCAQSAIEADCSTRTRNRHAASCGFFILETGKVGLCIFVLLSARLPAAPIEESKIGAE